jgi:hypothetical protein
MSHDQNLLVSLATSIVATRTADFLLHPQSREEKYHQFLPPSAYDTEIWSEPICPVSF